MSPGILAGRVRQACDARNCESAINLIEAEVRAQPCNPSLYYSLGLCYSGACGFSHPLICQDLAICYLRRALSLLKEDRGMGRATTLDALGTALVRGRDAPSAAAATAAIDCYREAARIYEKCGRLDDRARTLFNLANTNCELSEITGEDHWREAVYQYEESLQVRTLEKDPERHAAVLENLGSAYRRLSAGDPGENVTKSIRCYQRALRIYAPATHPDKSAGLHNNIGNAYLSLPQTDEKTTARNALRALHHFDRALRIQSRDKSSRAYGITQYNRSEAHHRLAQIAAAGNPKAAVTCLEEALSAFQSCGDDRYARLVRSQLKRICQR
jgi:tetratricopeptide (TPR) repeat protein